MKVTNKLVALGLLLMLVVPTKGFAEEIEEVIVVGAVEQETNSDASQEESLIEIVLPAMPDMAGGYGHRVPCTLRHTSPSHPPLVLARCEKSNPPAEAIFSLGSSSRVYEY